ncbi:hypothetical protein GPX89_06770 [Nocardia sp. ET3-3]|uniref:DUF8020 domain-containing protein n=1 Tax=Nocardia terrae TaxID=2675851 RepID=A0A7K1URL7_9NOCA|nr:hypothetical protein [Nocardia terrae]MVU76947.1 hypothetical protein [Nocardia terrae]
MKLRTTAFAALTAAGAMTIAAAPAHADEGPGVRYRAGVVGDSAVTVLDDGTFALAPDAGSVLVRDAGGNQILSLPLTFDLDGTPHPILQQISADGHRLALTPDTGLRPVASPMENQKALDEFAGNMSTGTLVGTVGGFVVGAVVGAAIGLGSCLIVGPGCLATAPAAIMAFAGGGMLVGTLGLGGAALVNGAWKYLTTLQAAPGQSAYADKDGLLVPDGTDVPNANLRIPPLPLKPLISGSSSGSGHH